jgi:hypothetical protein
MGNVPSDIYVLCKHNNEWTLIQQWKFDKKNNAISKDPVSSYGTKGMVELMYYVIEDFHKAILRNKFNPHFFEAYTNSGVYIRSQMIQKNGATVEFEFPYNPTKFKFVITTDEKFNDQTIKQQMPDIDIKKNPTWDVNRNYKSEFRNIIWDCCVKATMDSTIQSIIDDIVQRIENAKMESGHKIIGFIHNKFKNAKRTDPMTVQMTNAIIRKAGEVYRSEEKRAIEEFTTKKRKSECLKSSNTWTNTDTVFTEYLKTWFDKIIDKTWQHIKRDIKSDFSDQFQWLGMVNGIMLPMKNKMDEYIKDYNNTYTFNNWEMKQEMLQNAEQHSAAHLVGSRSANSIIIEQASREHEERTRALEEREARDKALRGCVILRMTNEAMIPIVALIGILSVAFHFDQTKLHKWPSVR